MSGCAFAKCDPTNADEMVGCDVCGRPVCDLHGWREPDGDEGWLCPDHLPLPPPGSAGEERHEFGPFDRDELVRWAENYGHPETWCKRAQQLHAENERLRAHLDKRQPSAGRLT